ncbi:putative MFS family arabinose efflux permease [Arthrobacter silviterrae]|uniref:MFS transporter n=1 Tax=Arthrobacter silviterrae TaxID=2026658 RepID=UPI00196B1FA6|nr:MFS transporter [Arthrobacter silviterrae]MDQ0276037.1 putative MFS family arabinose efflux permease [Arthrobacter silviterrae]
MSGTGTTPRTAPPAGPSGGRARNAFLALVTAAAFLTFAQAFMVAPILPQLAGAFGTDVDMAGLAVPAYLVPYGVMTLFWGPLSDRIGRRPIIAGSMVVFAALTAATALSPSAGVFIGMRVATGVAASGVVPISLALIGDVFAFAERGRALGWLFGGMAGGIAVGSTAGALAEPFLGWAGLFVASGAGILAMAGLAVLLLPAPRPASVVLPWAAVASGYWRLLATGRGARTYGYVLLNAVLHSGIYTWLGVFLAHRFGLGPIGVGLALLGYGIPGFLFGPLIGRLADSLGRARIIPAGMLVAAVCALVLAAAAPLPVVVAAIAALSLGYDMTQPLFGGIVTDLPGSIGQAVGLMAFVLFLGFGTGSLIFQAVLGAGFPVALAAFGIAALVAAAAAVPLFRTERPQ